MFRAALDMSQQNINNFLIGENFMKTLVLISTLLISITSFASVMDAPQVSFQGRSISIMKTCYNASNDTMRTAKKVTVYNRVETGRRTVWEEAGKAFLSTPRSFSYELATGGSGRNGTFETYYGAYNLNNKILVRSEGSGRRSFGPVISTINFKVPACK